jgi:hypothetical protein
MSGGYREEDLLGNVELRNIDIYIDYATLNSWGYKLLRSSQVYQYIYLIQELPHPKSGALILSQ